ncbi:MAG: hypothetical protein FJX77_16230 [Armatimonadetes bacterium]|nr:hypothetical protein [Armatimonadota bacterium]
MALNVSLELEQGTRAGAAAEDVAVEEPRAVTGPAGGGPSPSEARIRGLLAEWQAHDSGSALPLSPAAPPAVGGAELLAQWRELDARMTDEEREAEDRLWEAVVKGIDETRLGLDMRRLRV